MKAKVFCKTTDKGIQSFYVSVEGKTFFLFSQNYRVSNKSFFAHGVRVDELSNYAASRQGCVRKTLDKLPTYLKYIEKEYGVCIFDKSKQSKKERALTPYKRKPFRWQTVDWAVA